MEPWDGPASVAFTDGRVVGATLDRNGLRPGRWVMTTDGHVVLGSEIGLLDIPAEQVERLGRLQPGKLFLVDLQRGRIVEDGEVKRERIDAPSPMASGMARNAVRFGELEPSEQVTLSDQPLHARQRAFGYSQEDLRVLLTPMARDGAEPIGSMGNDLSLAVLSDQAPPLFSYFKQLFAQVTNPPIDPIREEIVMSLATTLGTERNLFDETPEHAHKLLLDQPILLNRELETLRHISHEVFSARTLDITWPVADGAEGMERALERVCEQAHEAIAEGVNILILSDRLLGPRRAPIPSLLAVSSVHHHLVREGTRLRAGIVLESGEPREVHHFATLIGYGVERDQSLPDAGDARRAGRARAHRAPGRTEAAPTPLSVRGGRAEHRQSDRQRAVEDDLEDGHLHDPVLPRRADLRGRGPRARADRPPLHRHRLAHRRRRSGRAGPGGAGAPRSRLGARAPIQRRAAAGRRRLCLAARRRAPHVEPRDDRARPARGALGERQRARRARRRRRRATARCARAPPTPSTASTPRAVNEDAARQATLRGLLRIGVEGRGAWRRRSRWSRSSPPRRSCGASVPGR